MKKALHTHRDIIDLWKNRADFAREVGVGYQTARMWYDRNSIPKDYWRSISATSNGMSAKLSVEKLSDLAPKRKKTLV